MATAEELLTSLLETDRTFVIDNDLRTIVIPSGVSNLGVQSDDDVLTVYFKMPSMYCGIDLSQFNIRINYLNAAGEGDYHDVDDAEVQSDGTIQFSWTVGRHAASVVGNVEFNVCMKKTDSSGNVVKEFNTTTATLPILNGLEVSEQVISKYNDILEQWRAKLFGIGDTEEGRILAASQEQQQSISDKAASVLSAIELKGSETLATIPDTYTEVYQMADEALRTKADAIVLEAEGTMISVNDSSDNHLMNLKLFGRTTQTKTTGTQLAYIPDVESFENNGITWSSNGGVVTAKGNAPIHSYTPSHIHAELKGLVGSFYLSGNSKYIKVAVQCTRDGVTNYINAPQEFTLDGTETRVELYCQITTYNTDINDTAYPMVNVGSTALSWEPYTGGKASPNPNHPQKLVNVENPTVSVYGKNLVKTNYNKDVEYEGLHFLIKKGLSEVTLNGTTTKPYGYAISEGTYLTPGRYTMSVYGLNDVSAKYDQAYLMNTNTRTTVCTEVKTGHPVTFDVVEAAVHRIDFLFAEGTTYNNTTVRFQIEAGDKSTEYEPCGSVQTLSLSNTLHGIPVTSGGNYTDENGQQWICDEVDFNRGVCIHRIGSLQFDGSSNWTTYTSGYGHYGFMIWHALNDTHSRSVGLCNQIPNVNLESDNCVWVGVNDDCLYVIIKEWYDKGLDVWKAHLNEKPLDVIYVLNAPIETPLTAEEILAYRALKTNRTNTTVVNDHDARMAISYHADTLKFLRDNHPKPTDEQVEAAVNEYIDKNGLVKTTASINNNILVIK